MGYGRDEVWTDQCPIDTYLKKHHMAKNVPHYADPEPKLIPIRRASAEMAGRWYSLTIEWSLTSINALRRLKVELYVKCFPADLFWNKQSSRKVFGPES